MILLDGHFFPGICLRKNLFILSYKLPVCGFASYFNLHSPDLGSIEGALYLALLQQLCLDKDLSYLRSFKCILFDHLYILADCDSSYL